MKNDQNIAIAFLNQNDVDAARKNCGELFDHLIKKPGDGMQIFVAEDEAGREAIRKIGATLNAYNRDCVELKQWKMFVQHGASLPWEHKPTGVIKNGDGSLSVEISTHPAGFFPFRTRPNFKDGKKVDGFHFAAPQASVIKMTLTIEGELTITEEVWQCKPADPRVSMIEGLRWGCLEKDGKPVKNVYTTGEVAVRGIFHCDFEARRASFFVRALDRLFNDMEAQKEIFRLAEERKRKITEMEASGIPKEVAVATVRRLEKKAR